ncbi:MAG: hypothetical protein J6R47_02780, partial [Acholeplasmatales bacterium]|nr:hypothetical protein [Acholeplasmatales bacterium]
MGAEIVIDVYVLNESIYLTLFGQTIQVTFNALGAIVDNALAMLQSEGDSTALESSIDLGMINSILDGIRFTDSTSFELSLNEIVSSLSTIAISLIVDKEADKINVNVNEITDLFNISLGDMVSDKTEIIAPEAEVFTEEDINNLFDTINVLIDKFNENDAFTLNIDALIYGINIQGVVELTKDLDIYANLVASVTDDNGEELSIVLDINYVNEKLYIDFNGLSIVFTHDDFEVIIGAVTELLDVYMSDNETENEGNSSLDIAGIVESILFSISSHSFTPEEIAIGLTLDILSLDGVQISLGASEDGINIAGKINNSIIINDLGVSFGMTEKNQINDSDYLPIANLVNIFENLETGILFNGEIKLEVAGFNVILPYQMNFRADLVDLLQTDNAFTAIELELVISSELYDPIILTIVDGFIYLDSMGTKFKYEIPQYSVNDAITQLSSEEEDVEEKTELDVLGLFADICGYVNGIEFITKNDEFTVLLSNDLMQTLNDLILDLTGMEIALVDLGISVTNISETTFDLDLHAQLNAMNMDVAFSLVADTVVKGYVSDLTDEAKEEFVLTEDFTEHPFAVRVLDIINMVKGIIAFDYSVNGQKFNLNIPLEVDNGLISSCTASGSLGVWLDIQSVLDGADIMSAFRFAADIQVTARVILFNVNIDIQAFYVGDGYIYVTISAIGMNVMEMVIDLGSDPAKDLTVGEATATETIIYLNDFINDLMNGFVTESDGLVTTLSLGAKSAEVVNEIWRMVVEMLLAEVDAVGVSYLTDLMAGISNLNMDVSGLIINSALKENNEFDYLKITLNGYRHGTFTSASLPITITHVGELSSD